MNLDSFFIFNNTVNALRGSSHSTVSFSINPKSNMVFVTQLKTNAKYKSNQTNADTTFGPSKVSELILGGINIVRTQLRGRGVAKMCENACSENALK